MNKAKKEDVKILITAGIILLVLFITFQSQDIKEVLRGTITGFGGLSQVDYCGGTWGSNGYWLTANVNCDATGFDGATFTGANTELDCKNYGLTASTSTAVFAMNLTKQASNMTVKRCQITNFAKFGIEIVSTNHSRIYDTNISGSGTYDLVLSSRSNNITVLNTTFTTVKVYSGANYTRQWYIDVRVNYSNGSATNAVVTAFNHTFANYRQTATVLGKTRFNATEYVNHSGTTTWFRTYKINATDGRYTKTNTTVKIGSGNVKILLEITPDDPPTVSNLTYPFNATTLTSVPIQFNFTVYDDWNATNCSMYANFNTSWVRNLTTYPDTNNTKQYNFTLKPAEGTYKWNVLCYDNSTNVQKDWYTSNFTFTLDLPNTNTGGSGGSGGGGGGGGDKEICKDECEIGEKSCDGNKIKICGYDEDYCKVFNQYQECKENEVCANGKCFEKCVNECETNYEKCSGNSIEKCYQSKDSTGQSCYRKSIIKCSEEKSCIEGRCIKIEKPVIIGKGNQTNITIQNAVLIGGGAVVTIIAISWWLWLLPFLIPFLFLRFRHYYVKVIDLEDCLEMNKNKEKNLVLALEKDFGERFGLTEQNKEYRNLNIEKGGSLEILEEKPFSLIAHFDKKRRAERFKEVLKLELGKIAKDKSKVLINSIKVEREHFRFTKRMVHLVKLLFKRKHKIKVIKKFKKGRLANNLEQLEMFYSGLEYLMAKLEKRIKEKIWYIGFDYSEEGRESFLLDKGGRIEMRIKRLGRFEFRLEAEKKRIGKLREEFEEVLGKVFESKGMWRLKVGGY